MATSTESERRSSRRPDRDDRPEGDRHGPEPDPSGSSSWNWTTIALIAGEGAGLVVLALYWWFDRDRRKHPGQDQDRRSLGQSHGQEQNKATLRVKVIHPSKGGMTRTTTMPGTLHAVQHADLYAKASGFLRAEGVDIGDTVEKGQVLAEVYDPER